VKNPAIPARFSPAKAESAEKRVLTGWLRQRGGILFSESILYPVHPVRLLLVSDCNSGESCNSNKIFPGTG
jgi:hypothetical protein